ncbi:MAG: squalene synthase HpnC [Methylacidiphilales bacterium]|nr:squalene synthase HpnC [Candidatus Methylacidiphilales bacterium]MDW8350084.1 squalene synthase HpnC [Verrucomicrobiae bacterium]
MPSLTADLDSAYAYCTELALKHYENFPVGRLVPKSIRKHVHAIYAFARHADDMADEGYPNSFSTNFNQPTTPSARLEALDNWERELMNMDHSSHPVFIALRHTIKEFDLPITLFTDLLSAFKQDVVKNRYANFDEVLDYSARSANPIGRLVLYLHRQATPQNLEASDKICTALQITNFWQDVSVDILKDRLYLPLDELARFGISERQILTQTAPLPAYKALIQFQVTRTEQWFQEGFCLISRLPWPLNFEIALTWHGGRRILDKIIACDYNTLFHRPRLKAFDIPLLLFRALKSLCKKPCSFNN